MPRDPSLPPRRGGPRGRHLPPTPDEAAAVDALLAALQTQYALPDGTPAPLALIARLARVPIYHIGSRREKRLPPDIAARLWAFQKKKVVPLESLPRSQPIVRKGHLTPEKRAAIVADMALPGAVARVVAERHGVALTTALNAAKQANVYVPAKRGTRPNSPAPPSPE